MITTGNKNFWKAQLIGWTIVATSNLLLQWFMGLPPSTYITNALLPLILGFLITTIYRYWIKNYAWKTWDFSKIILMIIGSTILLTVIFLVICHIFIWLLEGQGLYPEEFFSNFIIFGFIFLVWNLIYFLIHYFNRLHYAEIEKWKLVAEMKEAQLGSLKSQINPHFVFNALNNIRALILEDPSKAREMLLNFSDLFRYSLKHSDNATVPLEQELEIVEQYLDLLSIQFEDKLSYTLNIDNTLEMPDVPPMVLQLLVENAIKHGISQYKDGGDIVINIYENKNALHIEVKNTGSLEKTESLGNRLGVGLKNIKKRLDLIYNGNAHLHLKEVGNFVVASIKIPLL